MILECRSWQEKAEVHALEYATEMVKTFERALLVCAKLMPENTEETRAILLNTFIDSLVSVVANIIVSYSGQVDGKLEDAVIESFKQKFTELRIRKLGGKGQMQKLKIKDDEN